MVHVVTRDGGRGLECLEGTPVHPVDAAMIDCDCSRVAHEVSESGEPLNLGRRTRDWNTAQRRAIGVRAGGIVAFPAVGTATTTSTT